MSTIASEKQIKFILSLEEERTIEDLHPVLIGCLSDIKMGYADSINKKYASRMIEILMSQPRKAVTNENQPEIQSGRYAIEYGGKMRFFQISSPTEGRWAGFLFVNEQAGSEMYPVKDRRRRREILNLIANDPDALARYGQTLGYCGRCNRELTDETSRSLGLGPVCRSK